MSEKIILSLILLASSCAWAIPKRTIASKITFEEGIYNLDEGSKEKCSTGRIVWIEDTEFNSTGLQVGPLLIIPDIGSGEKTEELERKCTHRYLSSYLENQIVYETTDTCGNENLITKVDMYFFKGKIKYTVFKKKNSNDVYSKDFECTLIKRPESRENASVKPKKKRSK